jgi:DNA-binding XRE family transcriptional regulator
LQDEGENMESNELRFKHVGLSSDGAVIFCEMDNGKTYAMPLSALEKAEDWNPKAKPKAASIIHDGYAAIVEFDTGTKIDFPSDFVLHVCEPSYAYYKDKRRAVSGVGARIREIREARGLTLDALAAKCGIAKPNLSRLENNKVTPKFETLSTVAAALDVHPALLVKKHAWTWTQHTFGQWRLGLVWNGEVRDRLPEHAQPEDIVDVFLAKRPEHEYARVQLLKHFDHTLTLDPQKWESEKAAADAALKHARGRKTEREVAMIKPEKEQTMQPAQALEFLGILWENYHRLAQQVDLYLMPPAVFDAHVEQKVLVRPLRIASWFARQGYFISAWSLWEYYSRVFCERLPNTVPRNRHESCVDWVGRWLAANNIPFPRQKWFSGANALRNLIAHYSGRVTHPRALTLMNNAKAAFPKLESYADDYVVIESEHASELQFEIDEFIRNVA